MTVAVQEQTPLINLKLVRVHLIASIAFLIIAMLMGIFYALQLNNMYPFPGIEWLSPGRIRMIHTNGVAYGFIVNGFLGALYWAVPRLTRRRPLSDRLGWLIFWVYQFIVLWAVVGILSGHGQAV
ncbi:MAG: cytochrome oxidase, partial [Chloroflexi bacterium]